MPGELAAVIDELEAWTQANLTDARRSSMRFWMLKIPALLASAGSGLLTLTDSKALAAGAAAVSALCIGLDALNPGGQLRNAFVRAVHDLRALEQRLVDEWRIGILRGQEPRQLAADIIERSRAEWDRIAGELKAAESAVDRRT
jgi:hypothetical protein